MIKHLIILSLILLAGCSSVSGQGRGSNNGSTFVLGKMINF
jgi:hypothetical protein